MNKRRRWKSGWSRITVAGLLGMSTVLHPSVEVAANEQEITETVDVHQDLHPTMQIGQDHFSLTQKLNVALKNPKLLLGINGLSRPAEFFVYTNYPSYIRQYILSIYSADDISSNNPLKVFTWKDESIFKGIPWDGRFDNNQGMVEGGKQYKAVIEVIGEADQKDTSLPIFFDVIVADTSRMEKLATDPILLEEQEIPGYGIDNTAHRGILPEVTARKVVIQISHLKRANWVKLNGIELVADAKGNFVRELILPVGAHSFYLEWENEDERVFQETQTIEVSKDGGNDFFFVAQADLTFGKGFVSGHKEVLNGDCHYKSGAYADGRLAFYLKGTVKDKYRLTAHLDTGEERTSEMFGKIDQKDPRRVFRELNPLDHYPIYGDDSTLEQDVNTEGKFYVKLEKGKDHLLWGNYHTGFTGTEFGEYNRSLYGLQYFHEATETTQFGDTRDCVSLFAATGQSRASHNEFLSTGGSLYYLKYQRVTEGSAKLIAEIRDRDTGRVISRATLSEGSDYEIDNFQGRIMLKKPLPTRVDSDSIIATGAMTSGNDVYLVVDYEYHSDDLNLSSEGSQGGRAYGWIGDHVRLGTTAIRAEQDGDTDTYKFYGLDLTWKPAANTYTYLEYGKSKSGLGKFYESLNGGLNFRERSLANADSGSAFKIEQYLDLRDFNKTPLKFEGYFSKKNKGYSDLGTVTENQITEYGGALVYNLDEDSQNGLKLKYSYKEEKSLSEEKRLGLQYFREFSKSKGFRGAVELQKVDEWNESVGDADETLVAMKLEKDLKGGRDKVYLIQQISVDHSDKVRPNNRTTVGYEAQIKEYLRANVEGIVGNRGSGMNGGVAWDVNPRLQLYSRYQTDLDSTAGKSQTMTFGGDWKISDKTQFYSERQFINKRTERSTADVYGVKYRPSKTEAWDVNYTVEEVKQRSLLDEGGGLTSRDVVSIGYSYKGELADRFHKFEYRREKGDNAIRQIVTTNRIKSVERNGLSWLGA